jgi:hypothetical protein
VSAVVLTRLRDLFLDPHADPAARRPAKQVAERAVPSVLGVLTAREEAAPAGAALGLTAAAAAGMPCALVCHWTGEAANEAAATSGLAVRAARRLAARLTSRGLTASARGRLVTVVLPAAEPDARAAAERAFATAGDTPAVLVVSGPRPDNFDPLMAALDRLIVVPSPGAPTALEHLAVDAAARIGRATGVLRLPASGAATRRLVVSCGVLLSPALRAAAEAALRGRDGA